MSHDCTNSYQNAVKWTLQRSYGSEVACVAAVVKRSTVFSTVVWDAAASVEKCISRARETHSFLLCGLQGVGPNKPGLHVRPSVRTYNPPAHKKSFSNSHEMWLSHRGRWVMHDGMLLYDPIQGQGQGRETLKVRILTFSKSISSPSDCWQMSFDS